MASPQKENGYTPWANELLERLAVASLAGRELRIVIVVSRMSYGYSRNTAKLSSTYISKMTGIAPGHCRTLVAGLIAKNILFRAENGELGIQKDWEKWVAKRPGNGAPRKRSAPKTERSENGAEGAPETGRKAPRKRGTLKQIYKTTSKSTNSTEESKSSCSTEPSARRLADILISRKIRAAFKAGDIRREDGCNAIVGALKGLCGGLDYDDEQHVRAVLLTARSRTDLKNPYGWVVDVLKQPRYPPGDAAMEEAKAEMRGPPVKRGETGRPIGEVAGEIITEIETKRGEHGKRKQMQV